MLHTIIGPRMVMAGAGGINHEELCDLTTKHFGKIGHTYDAEIPLDLNCRYTGMLITDVTGFQGAKYVKLKNLY